MSFERLRYRKYASNEIATLLAPETAWYSRRVSFTNNAVDRTDTITVSAVHTADKALQVNVRATFLNTMDSITPLLTERGFAARPVDGCTALERVWSSSIACQQDALAVLARVVACVDDVAAGLPLLLYSSRARKIVTDYLGVMRSEAPYPVRKLNDIGGECSAGGKQRKLAFCVMKTAEAEWVAWLPGDEYVPLFPSQTAAVAVAKARQRLLAPECDIAVALFELPTGNVYRLADKRKSLLERIRWLRQESARLERLLPAFDPRLEQAE